MSKTYEYVSDRRLLYFTQKLKEHFPTASDFIDDTVAAVDKLYSSQKIEDLLDDKVDKETGKGLSTNDFDDDYKAFIDNFTIESYIDDTDTTSTDKLWSAKKIHDEIAAIAGLEFRKVEELPVEGQSNIIYLLPIRIITAVTTIAGTDAIVNKNTFVGKISASGTYVFTYVDDGTNPPSWQYNSTDITLAEYGITLSNPSATPLNNDTITVILARGTNPNVYEEYIWITADSAYELIGTTEADLSGYVKDEDMIEITTAEIDTIISTVWPS